MCTDKKILWDQATLREEKKNDLAFIATPKTAISSGESMPRQDAIAQRCEITFQVKIENLPLAIPNTIVTLVKSGLRYRLFIGGNEIGALNKKYTDMVNHCSSLNISYTGKIIQIKGILYARFKRIDS